MEERFNVDILNEEAEKIINVNDAVSIFTKYMIEKVNKEKLSNWQIIIIFFINLLIQSLSL